MRRGMVTSSNIFVPSVGESPNQLPGQTCGPRELVKPATCSDIDGRLLSLGLRHSESSSQDGWLLDMCGSKNFESTSRPHPL